MNFPFQSTAECLITDVCSSTYAFVNWISLTERLWWVSCIYAQKSEETIPACIHLTSLADSEDPFSLATSPERFSLQYFAEHHLCVLPVFFSFSHITLHKYNDDRAFKSSLGVNKVNLYTEEFLLLSSTGEAPLKKIWKSALQLMKNVHRFESWDSLTCLRLHPRRTIVATSKP